MKLLPESPRRAGRTIAIGAAIAASAIAAGVPAPACGGPAAAAGPAAEGAAPFPWWNDAVFYEIFVRSFRDSDGDGVGDLSGLIERLDYLNDGDPATTDDLGIGGIWLMPITESPSYHGYDVVDYLRVDREYGTNEDFRRLMREAHRRGIRVIIDLVLNHTGSGHPWFVEARTGPDAPTRDFYVWRNDDPGWKGPWGAPCWHPSGGGFYYGVFWSGMPDLNQRNPEVARETFRIVRFWLDEMGVDGFRLDAIKHLIEDGADQENTPATHEWFRAYHRFTKEIDPEALSVGEVWSSTDQVVPWIGDEVDLAFEFQTAGAFLAAARSERAAPAAEALRECVRLYPPGQYATFLSNHDQDRVMQQLRGNRNHARSAASLLLTAPGVPFVYYGEEIGHSGGKPDPNLRSPMQWSAGPGAGFTDGTPWRAPQGDHGTVNVTAQREDPESLLSHYRRLIAVRNASPALRRGSWTDVECSDRGIYACLRTDGRQHVLVAVNLTGETKDRYALSVPHGPLRGGPATRLLHPGGAPPPVTNAAGGFDAWMPAALPPYSTAILEIR